MRERKRGCSIRMEASGQSDSSATSPRGSHSLSGREPRPSTPIAHRYSHRAAQALALWTYDQFYFALCQCLTFSAADIPFYGMRPHKPVYIFSLYGSSAKCIRPIKTLWDVKDPTLWTDSRLTDGGKVVSPTHRPPRSTPQKTYFFSSGTHFC
jgi:hypothetical protein